MDIEINISFGANSVFVQSGSLNRQFANLMTLENKKIVEIGKTGEEIAKDDPQRWEKAKDTFVFEPIFDPQKFDAEHMYWATRLLASNIHYELRGANLVDKIICNVNIPKYELFKEKGRQYFETRLAGWSKLRTLNVNGMTAISKGWQYHFAELTLYWGRYISVALLIIILATRPNLLFNSFAPLIGMLSFGIVFVFFFLIWAVMSVTEIAWMVGMQLFLPKKTLHRMFSLYQLQFTPFNKISLSKLFANAILGKDE